MTFHNAVYGGKKNKMSFWHKLGICSQNYCLVPRMPALILLKQDV